MIKIEKIVTPSDQNPSIEELFEDTQSEPKKFNSGRKISKFKKTSFDPNNLFAVNFYNFGFSDDYDFADIGPKFFTASDNAGLR